MLLNWLTAAADGHGGISSVDRVGTSGLVDTYRITLADKTTYDFAVTNGRGIKSWDKTGTSGLVDTYKVTLDDGTAITYTVKNGEKGDKGDNTYTWVKYASQEPTEASHSMGDIPDDWRGEYNGPLAEAPTDWKQYKWFKHKGEKGDTGAPATIVSRSVTYQVSDSGTIIPSGAWGSSVPVVSQGKYLWTKTELQFNTGDPIVSYSVGRMGIDGTGSVSSVAGVSPDETGNVALTATDVGALSVSGGAMTGAINMNGQPISGLNDPTEDTQAARKVYVDTSFRKAAPRNLLDNSDFTNLVAQAGIGGNHGTIAYAADRWILDSGAVSFEAGVGLTLNGTIRQKLEFPPTGNATAFVGMASGEASISYADGAVTITSSGGVLKWAAMYTGVYTAATIPDYQPKDYGVELAECKRYYYYFDTGKNGIFLVCVQGITQIPGFLFNTTMRVRPTVNIKALKTWTSSAGFTDIIGSIGSYQVSKGGLKYIELTSVLPEAGLISMAVEFSADL